MSLTINPEKRNQTAEGQSEQDHLFYEWIEKRDDQIGNKLVEKYTPLVRIIVEKIYKTVPDTVIKDELFSLGLSGLFEAIEKYDPARDLKFETYASFRIRGAILDGLRKEDWLPRKAREKMKKIEKVAAALEQKKLRKVTPEEVSRETGYPVNEVYAVMNDYYTSNVLSIDDLTSQTNKDQEPRTLAIRDERVMTPEENVLYNEKIENLSNAIKKLTKKEQLVLSLFYKEQLTLTEIGKILNLSTSRISQIHTKCLSKLKKELQELQLL